MHTPATLSSDCHLHDAAYQLRAGRLACAWHMLGTCLSGAWQMLCAAWYLVLGTKHTPCDQHTIGRQHQADGNRFQDGVDGV